MSDNKIDWSNVDWKSGCTTLVWNGVFIIAALVLFSKTADLFTAFAPSQLLGYEGIESYYGMVVALMVEGIFVASKFMIASSKNPIAWLWNFGLMVITFAISAVAQSVDSIVVAGTLASQPVEIQLAVTWLVPMVPAAVVGMILLQGVIETIPPDFLPKKRPN